MGVSEKLISFVPRLEAPVNHICSWIKSDMEQTQIMLEAENALAVLKEIGEYAHRFPRRFWGQVGLLTATVVTTACTVLGVDTGTAPAETPVPTPRPEPSSTPVAAEATATTGAETTPTTSPKGERLLGSNIPSMGGGSVSGTELIIGPIQKLPEDIPPEIIQNYGFVADAERQTGITVQAGLGGPFYSVSGSLEVVQGLPLNQKESSPGTYVYGEGGNEIVVIAIREIIEDSQYFMGIGPDGKPVMIERTKDGKYNILNDRDLQLPGVQGWTAGKTSQETITMDLSTGYVTIGPETLSINAEAPAVTLIPFEQITSVAQLPILTREQLAVAEANLDFSDLSLAPLDVNVVGTGSDGSLDISLVGGPRQNRWFKVESGAKIDGANTYVIKMNGPQGQKICWNIVDLNPDPQISDSTLTMLHDPTEIYLYLDTSLNSQFNTPGVLPPPGSENIKTYIKEQHLDEVFQLLSAARGWEPGHKENFWNILIQLNGKHVPIKVVFK